MKRKLCFLIVFFFILTNLIAQNKFGRKQLIADVDTLYALMNEVHPNLFAVYPKADFEKELLNIKAAFKDSMTAIDFYSIITPLVVKIQDGHTSMSPPYNIIGEKKVQFPLDIEIDKKNFTVELKNSYSEETSSILKGAKILSINGRKTKDILNDFLTYASGENNLFKLERVQSDFSSLPYLLYGDSIFNVIYTYDNKIQKTIYLKGTSRQEYRKLKNENNQNVSFENYSFRIDSIHNIGIIDFRSFSNFDKFKVFLDTTFSVIKNRSINNLIIDIRKNGGGNSILGDEFFQYISPVAFSQYGKIIAKISPSLKTLYGDMIAEEPLGITTNDASLIPLRENVKRFKGNIYLLTSNYSFSSAADFAWAFQYFKMGKVIGEETGGLIVSYGDVAGFKLPNTKIRFGVSWKKFYGYGADDSHTHGVLPDYQIAADKAMDYAVQLIKKEGK